MDNYVQMKVRKWPNLFWCIDLHDAVITGKYNRYNNGAEVFPYAKETLDMLYRSKIHRTILWTSSHHDAIEKALKDHNLKFHYINENPECPNNEMCNFDKKFYFNFLIDDKSTFEGAKDWKEIYETLVELGEG